MMSALHREHAFSDMFVAYLLVRNIRYEEDRSIRSLIRVKKDVLGFCCCSLILARKANPRRSSPRSVRRRWLRW